MVKKLNKLFVFGAIIFLVLIAGHALAVVGGTSASSSEQTINLKDLSPFGTCGQLDCILKKIMDFIFYLAIPLTSIMVLWGGFQLLTAAGDPEKVKNGGKTVLYSAIGFAVVLLSKFVVALITDIIK